MDLEPALRRDVRRITQVLHEFAHERNWTYADEAMPPASGLAYYIEVVVNVDWYRYFVTFVTNGFTGVSEEKRKDEVRAYLRQELFPLHPPLFNAINLAVKDFQEYEEEGPLPLGPADVRVDDDFVKLYIHNTMIKN